MKAVKKRLHYLRCPFSEVILYWLRYLGTDQCLLFRVERCPLLGGSKCISSSYGKINWGASEPSVVQRLSAFRRVHY